MGATTANEPAKVSFSEDDFRQGPAHRTNEVTLARGGKLIVSLGSNPSTGYTWEEQTKNTDPAVLKQVKHERVAAKEARPGAGGSQTWTFEALKGGSTTLDFSYGRPWSGGEKGGWTLKINVKIQ